MGGVRHFTRFHHFDHVARGSAGSREVDAGDDVEDLGTPQTSAAQEAKGKGEAAPTGITAANTHGTGRQRDGFSLLQLTSEFRALRASVLRLWEPTIDLADHAAIKEMIRFNEAIDQAVAESVVTFSENAAKARDVFLRILGHDLRSPLNAIVLNAEYFERPKVETSRRVAAAKRIRRSAGSMTAMVNDLLEFSRLQLGGKIRFSRLAKTWSRHAKNFWKMRVARIQHANSRFERRRS